MTLQGNELITAQSVTSRSNPAASTFQTTAQDIANLSGTSQLPSSQMWNNCIVTPTTDPTVPANGLTMTLPAAQVILNGLPISIAAATITFPASSVIDKWVNPDGSILTVTATAANATTLPNYVPSKVHLYQINTGASSVVNCLRMTNDYRTPVKFNDNGLTVDNFAEYFALGASATAWSSGASSTYGQLISTTDGNVYQNVSGTGNLGTTKPTGTSSGIINGQVTLNYYCRTSYLGMMRYAQNNGVEYYFCNLQARRICHRVLTTGSPIGYPANTTMSSVVKTYIQGVFKHCIINRVASGTYLQDMKMIAGNVTAGNYIWIAQAGGGTASATATSALFSANSYTPGTSTVVDGGITWLCVYPAYSTQQYFWMNVDSTFLVYRTPDSHDSYAATLSSLLWRYLQLNPNDWSWLEDNSPQPSGSGTYQTYDQLFYNIMYYNLATQVVNNLSYTFQNEISPVDGSAYTIEFTEDNCEVQFGLRNSGALYTFLGNSANATYLNGFAATVNSGVSALLDLTYNVMATQYGESVASWISQGNFALYPRLNTQLFPEFYNIPGINQDTRNQLRSFVFNQYNCWMYDRGKDSFPQNMLGFLAARIWQNPQYAQSYVENTERYFANNSGALIGEEFAFYLDIKDSLVQRFTLLQFQNGIMTYEDGYQTVTSVQCMTPINANQQTANFTITVPASCEILSIVTRETANHAVTINIGSLSGGTDVVSGYSIPALSFKAVPIASIAKQVFGITTDVVVYVSSASWNSASINFQAKIVSL